MTNDDVAQILAQVILHDPRLGDPAAYDRSKKFAVDLAALINGADRATVTWALAELVAELVVTSPVPSHVLGDFEQLVTMLGRLRWDARYGEPPGLKLRSGRRRHR
jgi:hypothetical protein